MQLAPLFDYAETLLIANPTAEHWLDMQKSNIPETAWIFRLLLLSIVPPDYTLEALLACPSSFLRFSGKAVDAINFAQYAQPKHLTEERIKNMITVFDQGVTNSRKLLKFVRDRDLGLKPDLPRIINLYEQRIKS